MLYQIQKNNEHKKLKQNLIEMKNLVESLKETLVENERIVKSKDDFGKFNKDNKRYNTEEIQSEIVINI